MSESGMIKTLYEHRNTPKTEEGKAEMRAWLREDIKRLRERREEDANRPSFEKTRPGGWEDRTPVLEAALIDFKNWDEIFHSQEIDLRDQKVLELGSGKGFFMSVLQENGVDVTALDGRPRDLLGQAIEANFEDLPFSEDSFDVVFGTMIMDDLEYNQDYSKIVSEIRRVVKNGGYFAGVGTPHKRETREELGKAVVSRWSQKDRPFTADGEFPSSVEYELFKISK